MKNSESHFNEIAKNYDFWKKKNWYYYSNLINLYKSIIPKDKDILEIGCGTGDILSSVVSSHQKGLGIDISEEMIAIAQKKYSLLPNITFIREDIFLGSYIYHFKYIFLADVLEHVENVPRFMDTLYKRTETGSKIIISLANPLWEPILMLAEKLHMKMPEGPHKRLSIKETEDIFIKQGFKIIQKDYRLLVPKKIPGSDFINSIFYRSRFIRRLGFTIFWVLER